MKSPRQLVRERVGFYQELYEVQETDALVHELGRKTKVIFAEVTCGTVGSVFADVALAAHTPDTTSQWVVNIIASAGSLALVGLGFCGLTETTGMSNVLLGRSVLEEAPESANA